MHAGLSDFPCTVTVANASARNSRPGSWLLARLMKSWGWGYTGGGANTVLFGKNTFPLLLKGFSLRRQKTWSLARMKPGIFQRFWMSWITVKIRVWEQCPQVLAGKARKNANRTDFAHILGVFPPFQIVLGQMVPSESLNPDAVAKCIQQDTPTTAQEPDGRSWD